MRRPQLLLSMCYGTSKSCPSIFNKTYLLVAFGFFSRKGLIIYKPYMHFLNKLLGKIMLFSHKVFSKPVH